MQYFSAGDASIMCILCRGVVRFNKDNSDKFSGHLTKHHNITYKNSLIMIINMVDKDTLDQISWIAKDYIECNFQSDFNDLLEGVDKESDALVEGHTLFGNISQSELSEEQQATKNQQEGENESLDSQNYDDDDADDKVPSKNIAENIVSNTLGLNENISRDNKEEDKISIETQNKDNNSNKSVDECIGDSNGENVKLETENDNNQTNKYIEEETVNIDNKWLEDELMKVLEDEPDLHVLQKRMDENQEAMLVNNMELPESIYNEDQSAMNSINTEVNNKEQSESIYNAAAQNVLNGNFGAQAVINGNFGEQTVNNGHFRAQTAIHGNSVAQTVIHGNSAAPTVNNGSFPAQTANFRSETIINGNSAAQTIINGNSAAQTINNGNFPAQTANFRSETVINGHSSALTVINGNSSVKTAINGNFPVAAPTFDIRNNSKFKYNFTGINAKENKGQAKSLEEGKCKVPPSPKNKRKRVNDTQGFNLVNPAVQSKKYPTKRIIKVMNPKQNNKQDNANFKKPNTDQVGVRNLVPNLPGSINVSMVPTEVKPNLPNSVTISKIPKECGYCPMKFFTSNEKSAHEQKEHVAEFRYKCNSCSAGNLKKLNLFYHIQSKHLTGAEKITFDIETPDKNKPNKIDEFKSLNSIEKYSLKQRVKECGEPSSSGGLTYGKKSNYGDSNFGKLNGKSAIKKENIQKLLLSVKESQFKRNHLNITQFKPKASKVVEVMDLTDD